VAAPMPSARPVSTLDVGLAITAAVVGLVAVGSTLYLWLMLPNL
jgi:hypothetical protein